MLKRVIGACMALSLLCACSPQNELSQYHFTNLSYAYMGEKQFFAETCVYDFESDKTTTKDKYFLDIEGRDEYPIGAYDSKENTIIYSAKDKQDNNQVYVYDIQSKNTTQLTNESLEITNIIPRNNDYIVIGSNKKENDLLSLYSIDKKTHDVKQIEVTDPDGKYDDLSVWQIGYVPQTDGIIIQAASNSEEYKLTDEWNKQEEHETKDINIPFYHYYYHDGQLDYLFTKEMPKANGKLISNGKEVLVGVISDDNGMYTIKYDIENQKQEEIGTVADLSRAFYLDDDGQYLYTFESQMVRIKIEDGETETLDYSLKYSKNFDNFMLVKK